ncbi:hypothetical protein WA158_003703 [Blastocystis sp. Blastoise]
MSTESIDLLKEALGCDEETASFLLESSGGDVENAISLFLEMGGDTSITLESNVISKENIPEIPEKLTSSMLDSIKWSCSHCKDNINIPTDSTDLYKEECSMCFINWDDPQGVNICLRCYECFCSSSHCSFHSEKKNHPLYLHLHRVVLDNKTNNNVELTTVSIGEEGGYRDPHKEYTYETSLYCSVCHQYYDIPTGFERVVTEILHRNSHEKTQEEDRWKNEGIGSCKHTQQFICPSIPIMNTKQECDIHCSCCDIHENLWFCLTCGQYHCGRKQWAPNQPPGTMDIHCYECEDDASCCYGEVHIPNILSVFRTMGGILPENQEKSILERTLEMNKDFDWSMTDENGVEYKPLSGVGHVGLDNLGNSCYMNSILQILCHLPCMDKIMKSPRLLTHFRTCTRSPVNCIMCQFIKLYNELMFSSKTSVNPLMFKNISCKFSDFDNNKQQDSYEYFLYILNKLDSSLSSSLSFSSLFEFNTVDIKRCIECNHIKITRDLHTSLDVFLYDESQGNQKEYSIEQCIEKCFEEHNLDLQCDCCQKKTTFVCSSYLWSLPSVFSLHLSKYKLNRQTWEYEKLIADLCVSDNMNLDRYLYTHAKFLLSNNEYTLLTSKGLSPESIYYAYIQYSLLHPQETNPTHEVILNYLMKHPYSTESLSCIYALQSASLHKGKTANSGHYVSLLRESEKWALINDSKVVEYPHPSLSDSYLLFYTQQ